MRYCLIIKLKILKFIMYFLQAMFDFCIDNKKRRLTSMWLTSHPLCHPLFTRHLSVVQNHKAALWTSSELKFLLGNITVIYGSMDILLFWWAYNTFKTNITTTSLCFSSIVMVPYDKLPGWKTIKHIVSFFFLTEPHLQRGCLQFSFFYLVC